MRTTIAIIGGGFSGTATAINLLRLNPNGLDIVMIDNRADIARGLAYKQNQGRSRLNVPAGNMSALVDAPGDFLAFSQQYFPHTTTSSFMCRSFYGDYLSSLLKKTIDQLPTERSFSLIDDQAVDAYHDGQRVVIAFKGRAPLRVDHLVLATGHAPASPHPEAPKALLPAQVYEHGQEHHDSELLIGTGLTAVDMAIHSLDHDERRIIYLLSRRGLLPQPHRHSHTPGKIPADLLNKLEQPKLSLRERLKLFRREAALSELDWRDLIAALRPATPSLWRGLSAAEKRSFLRHLQPYWDSHRHRIDPEIHRKLMAAIEARRVVLLKGRITHSEKTEQGFKLTFRPRGANSTTQLILGRIINCVAPNADLAKLEQPLVKNLLSRGIVSQDALRIGLNITDELEVIDSRNRPLSWISYIGPLLKSNYWEATAVPELRQHANTLANRLVTNVARTVE